MIWDCILNVGGHFENLVKEGKFGEITNNALIPMNSFDLYDWTFLEMEHYWVYNLFFPICDSPLTFTFFLNKYHY